MKRLLCVVGSMNVGGAETFLMKVMRQIDRSKYQMDFVVTSNDRGFYEDEIAALGGKIYRTDLHTKHPVRSYRQLQKIVKENQYKCVFKLSNSPLGVTDLWAAKSGGAERIGVRSCIAKVNESKKSKLINALFRPSFNRITSCKIAPSKLAAEYTFGAKQVNKGQVHILHNGVDTDIFHYDADGRRKIREEFGLADKTVIGHIGRFSKQKNHSFLLRVFAEICKKDSTAVLLLVGGGELVGAVRQQAEVLKLTDRIIYAGIRSDIPQILSTMDVFVLPSLYEGMPNAIIEAQATGLPCVIADTVTREANITGLVEYLPLEDENKWAYKALEAAKTDRYDTKDDLIKNGYEIKTVAQKFAELLIGE